MKNENNIDNAGYELSPQQARVSRNIALLSENSEPGHNVHCVWRMPGAVDAHTLDQALAIIAEYWEILRTSYIRPVGFKEAVQVVRDEVVLTAQVSEMKGSAKSFDTLFKTRAVKPFCQESDSLLRVYLDIDYSSATPVSYLQLVACSLSFDATGLHCLFEQLAGFYHGQAIPDDDDVVQCVDVANWLNELHQSEEFAKDHDYWRSQLISEPGTRLRLATHRSGEQRAVMPITADAQVVDGLSRCAQQKGYSVDELLLAVWQALLAGYSDWQGLTVEFGVESRAEELEGYLGLLCSYLPLTVNYETAPTLTQLLKDNHRRMAAHLEKREYLNWRSAEHSTVNETRYGFQCIHHPDTQWGKSQATPIQSFSVSDVFSLQLCCDFRPGGVQLRLVYDNATFSAQSVAWIGARFAALLGSFEKILSTDANVCLAKLNVAPQPEVEFIRAAHTQLPHSSLNKLNGPTAHHQFAAIVQQTPDKAALQTEQGQWTYGQLNERAEVLAGYLQSLGLGQDTPLAVCTDRNEYLVISMLAVIHIGGVYIPLDAQLQPQRIEYIIGDSGSKHVLTVGNKLNTVKSLAIPILVDQLDEAQTTGAAFTPASINPQQLAYLIYTSGSTGTPKGVGISHQALCHYVAGLESRLVLADDAGLLALASVATDLGHTALFGALLTGRTLHLLHDDKATDVNGLARYLDVHSVSCLKIVPSHLRALLTVCEPARILPTECLVLGGEALPVALVKQVRKLNPELRIVNHYGPTEATVGILTHEMPESAPHSCPVGKPLAGAHAFVLDSTGRESGIGVVGELYLGGPALAQGYWQRGDLTAQHFVPDHLSGMTGARLYRSGDLAYYREDGELVYVGRADHQVKVRGFRVELPEIESVLCSHAGINEAVVLLQTPQSEADGTARAELVAHLVTAGDAPKDEVICDFLMQSLPEYMVPVLFNRLKQLPLTQSGKVDRKALPFINRQSGTDGDYQPPQTEMENTLVTLWQELLGIEKVSIKDNFFAIGGDSIVSIQLAARLNQLGFELMPKQLFDFSTIEQLAPQIEELEGAEADTGPVTGELPLTPIQQRYFQFADKDDLSYYNQAMLFDISDHVSAAQLAQVLRALANHHDMLRVRYKRLEDGSMMQYLNTECSWNMQTVKLPSDDAVTEQIAKANRALDIFDGCCVDARLLMVPGQTRQLLLCLHHLVVDGVSWRLIIEDLNQGLANVVSDQAIEFAVKTTSFKDWAEQQREHAQSDALKAQLSYWLAQKASTALPVDFSDHSSNLMADAQTIEMTLGAEATGQLLTDANRAYNTKIDDLLLAALSLALARWGDCGDIVVELEGHGREHMAGVEQQKARINITRTLGWFTSRYPVKLNCNQTDLADHITDIKELLRAVPEHGIGYGLLRYLCDDDRIRKQLDAAADGGVSFNYLGQFNDDRVVGALANPSSEEVTGVIGNRHPRSHKIQVNGLVLQGSLVCKIQYSGKRWSSQTIQRLADCLSATLKEVVSHCVNPDNRALTPSDFPLAGLSRKALSRLNSRYDLNADAVADLYPVTPLQHGMLFETQLNPGAGVNILQMDSTLTGLLSGDAWRSAWQVLVDRHSVFRTDFIDWQGETPLQRVSRQLDVPWVYEDWSDRHSEKQQADYQLLLERERTWEFDFSAVPLMRMVLVKFSDDSHKFIWTRHHSLMDGWSSARVLEEVLTAYEFINAGEATPLSPVVEYRNYVKWLQERRAVADDVDYWRRYLKGFNQQTPLTRQPRWLVGRNTEKSDFIEQLLPGNLSEQIQQFARNHHYTPGLILQAAWGILLSCYSGQSDVVFGSVVSGRPFAVKGVESIVGPCINTLPTRIRVNLERSVHTLLEALQVSNTERDGYAYTPLNDIQQLSSVPVGEPLFASLFVVQNFVTDTQRVQLEKDRTRSTVALNTAPTSYKISYPLTCFVNMAEQYSAKLYYDSDCMCPSVVKAFGQGLVDTLTFLVAEDMAAIAGYQLDCPSLETLQAQEQQLSVSDSSSDSSIHAAVATDSVEAESGKLSKRKVHHIGIACQDIQQGIEFVEATYDVIATSEVIYDPLQDANLCLLQTAHDIAIELVSGSQVQGMLQQGVSLYHTCFEVPDLEAEIAVYRAQGAMLVAPPKPALLFDSRRVCFLQTPIGLVELLEAAEQSAESAKPAVPVEKQKMSICVAATFTPESVEEPIDFWLQRLSMEAEVKIAPYGQLFQQLLDNTSLLRQNCDGINVLLIKLDDWFGASNEEQIIIAALEANIDQFISAVTQVKQGKSAPVLVVLTPLSPELLHNPEFADWICTQEQSIAKRLAQIDNVYVLDHQQVADWYPVADYYDANSEKLAHIPYTVPYQHALGTSISRCVHALSRPPFKVIVLDCDNTLWGGVVGEAGPDDIVLDEGFLTLQRKMVALAEQGMVVCLCSKNEEQDVFEVFTEHQDMILGREHIVTNRISWKAKSHGIKSMAKELNLGLDSFIFIDDDSVQCAEVALNCPQVAVIQTPSDSKDIPAWLNQVWALDQLSSNSVTTGRIELYQQNQARETARNQFDSLQDFIESLQLEINVEDICDGTLPRVSELLLRTNQFNFSTRRHSLADLTRWMQESSIEGVTVKVSDRFGDYGVVGVALYRVADSILDLDSMLLSCRALGRGVEHHLLREIGARAQAAGATKVQLNYVQTPKNTPARDFLIEVLGRDISAADPADSFQVAADVAVGFAFNPHVNNQPVDKSEPGAYVSPVSAIGGDNRLFDSIAKTLDSVERIVATANQSSKGRNVHRADYRAPENEVECYLAELWSQILLVDNVGLDDHFFQLGGHSLLATRVLSQVCNQYDVEMQLASIFDSPTLVDFAQAVSVARWIVDESEQDDMEMEEGSI